MHRCVTTIRGDSIAVNMLGDPETVCSRRRLPRRERLPWRPCAWRKVWPMLAPVVPPESADSSGTTADGGLTTAALGFAALFAAAFAFSGRGLVSTASSGGAPAVAAAARLDVFLADGLGASLHRLRFGGSAGWRLSNGCGATLGRLLGDWFGCFLHRLRFGGTTAGVSATATVRRLAVFLETGLGASCTGSVRGKRRLASLQRRRCDAWPSSLRLVWVLPAPALVRERH